MDNKKNIKHTSELFKNIENSSDDFKKIFSIINIKEIKNQDEFNLLISHLTNNSTPLREATALKLEELCKKYINFYLNDYSILQIQKGITDINPNISRCICNIIQENINLQTILEPLLIKQIENLLKEIEFFESENKDFFNKSTKKSHAKNKKLFSLYWLLESLSLCISNKYNENITNFLSKTIDFKDYTIREKTAKILTKMENPSKELLKKAKDDQNFYVKSLVCDKMDKE